MMHPLLFIVGYAVISVSAPDIVCFVNALSARGIVYHDMGERDGRRYFRVSAFSYLRVAALGDILEIEIRTEQKRGIPFLLRRLFRRWGLVLGGIFAVVCMVLSQRVVWSIDIEGNKNVPDEAIIEMLGTCGLTVGAELSLIDVDSVENRFLILSDDISWITVNLVGTVAKVEVREVARAEEDQGYVCSNLIAAKNGRIVEFSKVRGDICVRLGDAVSEGQLLVSGVYGSDTTSARFVRSCGQVFAACEKEYFIEIPLEYEKKVYTGEQKIKKSIIFFEKEVKFFGNSGNSYASCDTIEVVKYADAFGLGKLPFGIRSVTYLEYTVKTAVRTEEEAREEAIRQLWQRVADDSPEGQVLSKSLVGELTDKGYVLRARVTTLENIAIEQEVKIEIIN